MTGNLSNTTILGVIILALQLMVKMNFLHLRVIGAVSRILGVSRKAGYEARDRILRLLLQYDGESYEALRKKNLQLKAKIEILTYERDHPEVRFEGNKHPPPEARELSVRIFRNLKGELTETEIARALGVSLTSLRRWAKQADPEGRIPRKPERRGAHNRITEEEEKQVLELYVGLRRDVTLEEFTELYRESYPDAPLDRKTISRVLQRERLRDIETSRRQKPYRARFEVFFPGAQVSLDAKEVEVCFESEPEETYKVSSETAHDIASGAILGNALGKEETSEGVRKVLVEVEKECESVLAFLSDNGSANGSHAVHEFMKRASDVGPIYTFPYHPWTNGHIEGLFGQFSRIVGQIRIDDTSRESLAMSIVKAIWRIYVHFHNHCPRKRLGGISPLEYFRSYIPRPEELEGARQKLQRQKKRSDSRKKNPRAADPALRSAVERLLGAFQLGVDFNHALNALKDFDSQVIENAERTFFAYSRREGFPKEKLTFAYFMGIVRKKQEERDREKRIEYLEFQKTERRRREEEDRTREKEERLLNHPEEAILSGARLLIKGRFRFLWYTFLEKVRSGLKRLIEIGRGTREVLERLSDEIRSWDFDDELKERMVSVLFQEFEGIKNSS